MRERIPHGPTARGQGRVPLVGGAKQTLPWEDPTHTLRIAQNVQTPE
jgi:hypothetical protein